MNDYKMTLEEYALEIRGDKKPLECVKRFVSFRISNNLVNNEAFEHIKHITELVEDYERVGLKEQIDKNNKVVFSYDDEVFAIISYRVDDGYKVNFDFPKINSLLEDIDYTNPYVVFLVAFINIKDILGDDNFEYALCYMAAAFVKNIKAKKERYEFYNDVYEDKFGRIIRRRDRVVVGFRDSNNVVTHY